MKRLKERLLSGPAIGVNIVGIGFMGKTLLAQLRSLDGFSPMVLSSRTPKNTVEILKGWGISPEEYVETDSVEEALLALDEGRMVVTGNNDLAARCGGEAVVDATGNPEAGYRLAVNALEHGRHVISLNVECDVLLGHRLRDLARDRGRVYTGVDGDEPGSIMEIYRFCDFLGFQVVALGKGKNNVLRIDATPEDLREEAEERGLSPRMLTSFVDGTNTMIELNAVANSTGFLPDVPGCHGLESDPQHLAEKFLRKEEGGMMNRERVLEYVKGMAPGVFAIVRAEDPTMDYGMRFLKMGDGPLYTIYRPYHLTSMEVPITIARAVLDQEETLVTLDRPRARTVAVAKKDLSQGECPEGIGSSKVYGSLWSIDEAKGYVPIGALTAGATMKRSVKKGQPLSWEDVILENLPLTQDLLEDLGFSQEMIDSNKLIG